MFAALGAALAGAVGASEPELAGAGALAGACAGLDAAEAAAGCGGGTVLGAGEAGLSTARVSLFAAAPSNSIEVVPPCVAGAAASLRERIAASAARSAS